MYIKATNTEPYSSEDALELIDEIKVCSDELERKFLAYLRRKRTTDAVGSQISNIKYTALEVKDRAEKLARWAERVEEFYD